MKKKIQGFVIVGLLLCFGFAFAACSAPQTPDTSAVAGKYYQHEGNVINGAPITNKWIRLYGNGTWSTVEDSRGGASHTFTISGTEISLYVGSMEMMYGTLIDGKLTLQIWNVVNWVESIFFLETAN